MTKMVTAIRWPLRFTPPNAPVHVVNEREIAAPPAVVWAALIGAVAWPTWYRNAHDVQIVGGGQLLCLGARFRWRTFSVGLLSRVQEFEPCERIAWTGESWGVCVYHAWLITPTARGSLVRTEERQSGALARLANAILPRRMSEGHRVWLDSLAALTERRLTAPRRDDGAMPPDGRPEGEGDDVPRGRARHGDERRTVRSDRS